MVSEWLEKLGMTEEDSSDTSVQGRDINIIIGDTVVTGNTLQTGYEVGDLAYFSPYIGEEASSESLMIVFAAS